MSWGVHGQSFPRHAYGCDGYVGELRGGSFSRWPLNLRHRRRMGIWRNLREERLGLFPKENFRRSSPAV